MLFLTSKGQQSEWRSWLGVDLKHKVNKDLKLQFKLQDRYDFLSESNNLVLQPKVAHELNKSWSTSLAYRLTTNGAEFKHRIDARIKAEEKLVKRTWVGAELKYQYQTLDEWGNWENLFRTDVELSHRVKKTDFKPFLSLEGFYSFNYKYNGWDGMRLFIGADQKLNKRQDIGLKFGYRTKPDRAEKLDQLIIALSFSQEIK
jgi:hypothetical protein